MMDEILIYPVVRRVVSRLATLASALAFASAVCALLELLLLALNVSGGLWAGALSGVLSKLLAAVLCLLSPWCHTVLLAGRGFDVTRWLTWFLAVAGLAILACLLEMFVSPKPFLSHPENLPPMALILMSVIAAFNLPRMAAAPLGWRVAIVAAPALLLAANVADLPVFLLMLAAAALKLAAAFALLPLMRALGHAAPLIVSLPDPLQTTRRKP